MRQISVDGVELPVPDGLESVVRLALPAPLTPGVETQLRVGYRDSWSLEGASSGDPNRATALVHPLPQVGGRPPPELTLSVGTPLASRLASAQTGTTTREWTEGETRWVESHARDLTCTPALVLGDWTTLTEAAQAGLPSIRVNLFSKDAATIDTIPPFLRAIVAWDQQVLPTFPNAELELLQQRDDAGHFTWTSSPGLITIQQMRVGGGESAHRADRPHLEAEVMAHEIAHQWWGGLAEPARREDRWISETMATVYATLFLGAAYGGQDVAPRVDGWRESWEARANPTFSASLRDAWGSDAWRDVAYAYGPYLMLHMLRGRIGVNAFMGGLDTFVAESGAQDATADRLQAAFERASGRDLGDFFSYWVIGGNIPTLALVMEGAHGRITSSVPFGRFDVPVAAMTPAGRQEIWVDVIDGEGSFDLDGPPSKVLLDPNGMVLARGRKVSKR